MSTINNITSSCLFISIRIYTLRIKGGQVLYTLQVIYWSPGTIFMKWNLITINSCFQNLSEQSAGTKDTKFVLTVSCPLIWFFCFNFLFGRQISWLLQWTLHFLKSHPIVVSWFLEDTSISQQNLPAGANIYTIQS